VDPCPFDRLVVIETRRAGMIRNVNSVRGAVMSLAGLTEAPAQQLRNDRAAAHVAHP
jgi:hypothetical protein